MNIWARKLGQRALLAVGLSISGVGIAAAADAGVVPSGGSSGVRFDGIPTAALVRLTGPSGVQYQGAAGTVVWPGGLPDGQYRYEILTVVELETEAASIKQRLDNGRPLVAAPAKLGHRRQASGQFLIHEGTVVSGGESEQ